VQYQASCSCIGNFRYSKVIKKASFIKGISSEGCESTCEAVKDNVTISSLELRSVNFGDEGVWVGHLPTLLKFNKVLVELNLQRGFNVEKIEYTDCEFAEKNGIKLKTSYCIGLLIPSFFILK
jgi:hypothetical protein